MGLREAEGKEKAGKPGSPFSSQPTRGREASVVGGTRGQRATSKNNAGMGTFLWSWDAFHTTH